MKILNIYSFSNPVSSYKTRSVVSAGTSYINNSSLCKEIVVVSIHNETPLNIKATIKLITATSNRRYHQKIIDYIYSNVGTLKLVEIHQDASLAAKVGKIFNNKLKVVLIKHGPCLKKRFHERLFLVRKLYEVTLLSKIDYVMGVSNYVTNQLKKKYPKYSANIRLLYNTYGYLKHLPSNAHSIERENIIAYVGKPMKKKGIELFVKSLPKVLSSAPHFKAEIMAGLFSSKAKYRNKFLKLISNPEIQSLIKADRIIIKESLSVEQVMTRLEKVMILVFPSLVTEPFGLSALEGIISGCIVLSSGTGGQKEIGGDFVYYLDTLTVHNMQNKLTHIINHLSDSRSMAQQARSYALKKFNPQARTQEFDEFRLKIINNQSEE